MNSDIDNPEGLELNQIDIHELLPQQEPFVMIDRLVYCDKTVTLAETEIRNDDIFVENGHLSASGLIENIAQTCAARIDITTIFIRKESKLVLSGPYAIWTFYSFHLWGKSSPPV